MSTDPKVLADDRLPTCPYCGCARQDSERLHDGNVMTTTELVDAMLIIFLRNPEDNRPPGIWPNDFPDSYHDEAVTRLRVKMEAALGTAIRNMPYLAALRTPGPDAGGAAAMREAAAKVCHEEQMTVWTGEIAGRLAMGGYLRDDTTYEDVLDIHAALADEIRRIVESAFSHPELTSQEGSGC